MLATGCAVGPDATPSASSESGFARSADVVVIGAGLAGLSAARSIAQAGHTVAVTEARDRVGGRTWTVQQNGTFIDVGGQFVGPTQTAIIELAKSLGVQRFKPYTSGKRLFERNGTITRYSELPPLSNAERKAYDAAREKLVQMSLTVPLDAPWTAPRAQEWDWQTVQSWLDANVKEPEAKRLLRTEIEGMWTVAAGEFSMLMYLFGSATGPDSELPETHRFVGGAQQICQLMADQLGNSVILNAPVSRVTQSSSGVTIDSAAGQITAQRVIVAVSPALAGRLEYDPPLPPTRDGLTQRYPNGSVIKCQAIYPTPFWREQGLSGESFNLDLPVTSTFDNGPPQQGPGVLLGFVNVNNARLLATKSPDARRSFVLDSFAKLFGPQAAQPIGYVEGNWSAEQFTRGGYGGVTTPGTWVGFGTAWKSPVNNIYWASSETASRWNGFMDGAVRAGNNAATEVLASLKAAGG